MEIKNGELKSVSHIKQKAVNTEYQPLSFIGY